MIIEKLLSVVLGVLTSLFSHLPTLPALGSDIMEVWTLYTGYVFDGVSYLGNWINLPFALSLVALNLVVHNFVQIYGFLAWFVDKIPFINVKL